MHKYGVILFERVKVMIAIALIHLCLEGDSTLSYVKIKVLLFLLATAALSSKMIQLNLTASWKAVLRYIYKYMVLQIYSLKYFEQCI